jgi:hypothetical protein
MSPQALEAAIDARVEELKLLAAKTAAIYARLRIVVRSYVRLD